MIQPSNVATLVNRPARLALRPPVRSLLLAAALFAVCGCATPGRLHTAARYARGVVFVLPGIEGPSPLNRDVALGLDDGGVSSAIEIYDWTVGVPGSMIVNLAYLERNRAQAQRLADRIVEYRALRPGRPVHLVGHSGGAAIAIMALEALPPGRQIDMAILLAPAISPGYDLTTALRRTRRGIVNFYSERDVGLLRVGTTIFGSVDREHGASAGATGFSVPAGLGEASRGLYASKLHQVAWDPRLRRAGASGTHIGWASREFAAGFLASLIVESEAAAAARRPYGDPQRLDSE